MNGQKKFVHEATNVNSASMAAAGLAAGNATCQNVRIMEHPSTRAASISSKGSVSSKYWVIQKTPNAVTIPGTMTAMSLPVQPSSDIRMNSGTTPSWVGTAIVAMTNTSRARRPRNRSLAKENPARVANSTTLIDVITATMTEFHRACQNLMSELSTRLTFSKKFGPGISDGIGFWAIVWESDDANRNV
jgi:hypothetical protein